MGVEFEFNREDFDLDEDDPLRAERHEREFDALVAKSVDGHWSLGGRAGIDASTFNNLALRTFAGPAVEYNVFPYSQYTRRQLRIGYAVGPYYARYREETLFLKRTDTMAQRRPDRLSTLDPRPAPIDQTEWNASCMD